MESSSSAWVEVPRVLRCAMTKLAESMASTTQRVSRVEDEVECERARWTEATARLLERIDELERGQRAAIDHLETSIRQAESTHREERRVLEDQLNSLKEEMITRYEESQASTKVAALPREPPNPITIETTKCYQNNDQLGRDALAATAFLQDQMQARPSRQECHLIAEDAVACQVAPLKTDLAMVLRHFQRHQPTESVALPPTPAKEENVSFSVKSEAMCDESYFLRRCEAVEKRCNEVVATLNQKAYKVDVNRALENFDRRLRTAASSPPQVIPFSQDYQSDRPGEDLRQLLDASKEALEKAVEGIKSRLDALERNVGTVHSGLAKDVETLRDEIRRREQRQKSEKLSNPSPVNASTRNVSNHESTRRAIEELRRDLTALVEIKCSNSSTDRLESRLRADLEAQVKNRFCQCEPIIRRGRWLWRSGRLAHGNLIQWDLEAVNSEREAFSWQQNSPAYVKTTIAGLYRVAVGLFTRANASIHLCVDGYVVLSRESGGDRINSAVREDHSSEIFGSSIAANLNTQQQTTWHPTGEITCICIDEYVALPTTTELSVRCDFGAQRRNSIPLTTF